MQNDCIFCNIYRGNIPSEILYKDDQCFVIRDISPKAPIHLLIIPIEHLTYLTNMKPEHLKLISHLFLIAPKIASKEGLTEKGFRLIVNQGTEAGQEIAHLHFHLLGGRHLGDMG